MSIFIPSTMDSAQGAAGQERKIELAWTRITKEGCETICRALVDREADIPVRVLSLTDNQLGPAQAQKIASCLESSPVREVRMRYNDIGRDGCDGLAGVLNVSSKMERLNIRGNQLVCGDARKLLRALTTSTSLTHFSIGDNKLGSDGAALLAKALEKNTYLVYLDVSANEIGPAGAESIAKLLTNPASTLRNVELHKNYLGVLGVRRICQAMKGNKEVRRLTLGCNHATDEAAVEIAAMLASNVTLQELDLRLNSFTAAAVKALTSGGLDKNVALRTLSLAGNPLGPVGGEELARMLIAHQRSGIAELDLSSCELGPRGGMRLAHLIGGSVTLKSVNLSDNQLDDEAATVLARNVGNGISITVLDLSCNAIGEAGASDLIDAALMNAHLCSLILHGNHISRVVQKKIDNLLEERLTRNRVQSNTAALQQRQRLSRDFAVAVA